MSFQTKKEMTMKAVPKRERTEVIVVKISLALLRSSIFFPLGSLDKFSAANNSYRYTEVMNE